VITEIEALDVQLLSQNDTSDVISDEWRDLPPLTWLTPEIASKPSTPRTASPGLESDWRGFPGDSETSLWLSGTVNPRDVFRSANFRSFAYSKQNSFKPVKGPG
jgi:hypothetical protein